MERKRRYKLLNRHAIGGIFAICIVFLIHKRIRQFLYVTWITIATTNNVNGQATIDSSETFRYQQLIAPATLITLGSIGVNNTFICHLKHEIKDEFSDLRGDSRFHADDYIQYVPFATGLGLNLTGIPARHDLKERMAITATAWLTMGIIVNATKHTVKEQRPDSEARNSFPSGHTATAFTGAEIVRREYGLSYGVAAYVLASGVGFLRIYNDRHFLNDVLAGAGIGILSANIGYWLLPLECKILGWNPSAEQVVICPTYIPSTNQIGLTVNMAF